MSASVLPDETPDPVISAEIALDRRGDLLVVRPLGAVDRRAIPRIRRIVSGADRPVILDLDHAVLVDPGLLLAYDFHPSTGGAADLRIACGRLSCRRLLARARATERYEIFETVEDAVHAGTDPIRTGVTVTAAPDGSSVASLDVRGHLCAATAPALHAEVAQLIADGVSQISVELGSLDRCERHGVAAPRVVGASDAQAEVVSAAAAAVVAGVFDAMAHARSAATFDIPADAHRLAALRGEHLTRG